MNPNPLSSLNHFTVPVAKAASLRRRRGGVKVPWLATCVPVYTLAAHQPIARVRADRVPPRPAVDHVALAVPRTDRVVAAARVHVIAPGARIDPVLARPALDLVVARAAGDLVAAALGRDQVVAGPTV